MRGLLRLRYYDWVWGVGPWYPESWHGVLRNVRNGYITTTQCTLPHLPRLSGSIKSILPRFFLVRVDRVLIPPNPHNLTKLRVHDRGEVRALIRDRVLL